MVVVFPAAQRHPPTSTGYSLGSAVSKSTPENVLGLAISSPRPAMVI